MVGLGLGQVGSVTSPTASGILCITPSHVAAHPEPRSRPKGLAVLGTGLWSPQPAPSQTLATAQDMSSGVKPWGGGEREQNESGQYLVGVEGLEAGLGRAVEGAADTETVVQDLQLRDNSREAERRGRGEEEGRERNSEKEPRSKDKKNKKQKHKSVTIQTITAQQHQANETPTTPSRRDPPAARQREDRTARSPGRPLQPLRSARPHCTGCSTCQQPSHLPGTRCWSPRPEDPGSVKKLEKPVLDGGLCPEEKNM